jgi:hypothetical protein
VPRLCSSGGSETGLTGGTTQKIDIAYRGAVTTPLPQLQHPPRRRRTWLIVVVAVALLVLVVCALGLGRLVFRLKQVTDTEKDVTTATAAFIEDSRDGLSQAGYDGLCAAAREEFRPQDLSAAPPAETAITGFRIRTTDIERARGQATVTVELQRADGTTATDVYVLDEEAERWRMCAFPR